VRSIFLGACAWLLFVAIAPAMAEEAAAADPVICPRCTGTGSQPCKAKCRDGRVRCPKPCLKKEDAGWRQGKDVGMDPAKLWKLFPSKKKGVQGGQYWSQSHLGELIEYQDGLPVNRGPCPTCAGKTTIACQACTGTGSMPCSLCAGAKSVTRQAADAFARDQAKALDADAITLKDGRVLHGKIMMRTAEKVVIKTSDGQIEEVPADQVVAEPAPRP
jgi:hypothetical protein